MRCRRQPARVQQKTGGHHHGGAGFEAESARITLLVATRKDGLPHGNDAHAGVTHPAFVHCSPARHGVKVRSRERPRHARAGQYRRAPQHG
jgi:hypothetical protein